MITLKYLPLGRGLDQNIIIKKLVSGIKIKPNNTNVVALTDLSNHLDLLLASSVQILENNRHFFKL